ncbi:hypothetical protein [Cupriavidus basilensis]|uniref:Uncharacterized protein n=1 Tax=Cupriavidus basilensis TaxID=68895 RepID=A0A643FIB4_9BURK|nr:hypothetical protein [Cupriavidus basilensis]QOT76346.1 hypothetical protein F7R26_019825 [Cupriavidus basilensis]
MRTARASYVPATTRAALARFGVSVVASVDGTKISVSPYELPGEVEWRVDMLHWYITKVVLDLMWLPREELMAYLERTKQALVAESNLHQLEADLVVDAASSTLQRLDWSPTGAPEARARLVDHVHSTWDALQERYVNIVSSSPQR